MFLTIQNVPLKWIYISKQQPRLRLQQKATFLTEVTFNPFRGCLTDTFALRYKTVCQSN